MKNRYVIFIFLLALFLAPFFYLQIFVKKIFRRPRKNLRVLVIQSAKIGDMVCTTPVFREIKKHYPDSKLVVLATPRAIGIIKNNKNIDEIIPYNLIQFQGLKKTFQLLRKIKSYCFDVSIVIVPGTINCLAPFFAAIPKRIANIMPEHGFRFRLLSVFNTDSLKYRKNTLGLKHYLELLKFIGIKDYSLKKEVFTDSASVSKADRFLKEKNISDQDFLVGIGITPGTKLKEWSPQKFARLADLIIQKYGYKVVLLGGPKDGEQVRYVARQMKEPVIFTFDDFGLPEVPALIERFKVYISVDSGPLYIANALDVPVIDIIGPCSPWDQPPIYEKCEIVKQENLPCWPCSSLAKTRVKCREGHRRCLIDLGPEDVLEAFDKVIQKYYSSANNPEGATKYA